MNDVNHRYDTFPDLVTPITKKRKNRLIRVAVPARNFNNRVSAAESIMNEVRGFIIHVFKVRYFNSLILLERLKLGIQLKAKVSCAMLSF